MNLELADTKSFGGGFSTASGREVKISEEALNNARKLFKDETDFDDASTSNADSATAKPASVAVGGFATASGKPTTVSKTALLKAQKLFDDIDSNAASTPTTPSLGAGRLPLASRLQPNSNSRRSFQPPRAATPVVVRSEVLAEKSNAGNITPVMSVGDRFLHGHNTPIRTVARGGVLAGSSPATQVVTPIGLLSPYTSKWKICGIVTAKEEIRTIKTARGDTKAFHFEMVDQEGMDVRVSAWNELADKYYSTITKGQMYYLSGATVKQTNKRFNTTKHEYELSLRSDSEIVSCSDRAQFAAPRIRFQFVKFNQLKNCIGTSVDIIGVVQSVENVVAVPSRKTNEDLNKRDIHLVDDTNLMVTLTLWGEQARNFTTNNQEHPIIALKGVSVREFRGLLKRICGKQFTPLTNLLYQCISQAATKDSGFIMEMNPDFPEAYELSGWYEEQGANIEQQVVAISRDNSGPRDGLWDMRMIGIAEALQLGNRDEEKGAYFNVKGMIANMKTENALYKACIEEGCKKKLTDVYGNGVLYRCEKCNKNSSEFKYITLLSAEMTDLTGAHWVTMFEESAHKLLGKSAAELGTLLEEDKDAYYAVFETVRFKSFIFRIRSKMETYNDEQRIKWTVYDVRPVPWDNYIDALNKAIQMLAAL